MYTSVLFLPCSLHTGRAVESMGEKVGGEKVR